MTYAWTEEGIIEAFHRWADEVGETPSAAHWETRQPHPHWARHRGHFPTRQTVCNYFGTWRKGLAAAGLQPRKGGRPFGHTNDVARSHREKEERDRLVAQRANLREELSQIERELEAVA